MITESSRVLSTQAVFNTAADNVSVASASSSTTASSTITTDKRLQRDSQKVREMTKLPKDFLPSETDVVIGRGKRARTHNGNQRLRGLIEFMIPEYSSAGSNKDEKSYIIKEIVTQIRKSSPLGGFVKFDKQQNRWFEVGDFLAREKVSQTFRDAMGDAYSSSNPYKRKRRSFEKKHNAVLDVIKCRSESSPISVLQTGASSPTSPPPPEPALANDTIKSVERASVAISTEAIPCHISPPQPNPHGIVLENISMLNKRPGQIGFARRSMLHFGLPGVAPPVVRSSSMPMPPMSFATANALDILRRPIAAFTGGGPTMSMQPMAPPSRRLSMPYSAIRLSTEMIHQHLTAVREATMIRRPSTGS